MSTLSEIEAAVATLPPAQLRELLDYLTTKLAPSLPRRQESECRQTPRPVFEVFTGSDGLPVIRAADGVITSARVREIEGLAS
jgi:hypothetical protein